MSVEYTFSIAGVFTVAHIQLQNENDDLKGINYKMNANTKRGAQPLLFVQKNPGWQSVL
jgi:hypothetical protein